jgi:tetratricopeptide (TPR) repeat protein
LRTSPRLFYEDSESNVFLPEITILSDLTINRANYENFEEILRSIQKKSQEKNYSLHKRKLYFLNNLVKYMKIALKMCTLGKVNYKLERNYERALTFYQYCVEITEELIQSIQKSKCPAPKGSKGSLSKTEIKEIFDNEENRVINENSINVEFTEEDFSEYSSFYDNRDFLVSIQIKLFHSIIYCNQRLFLFNEITHYCEKILALDSKDWVARLKRGLYYFLLQDFVKAEVDFKAALEGSPEREKLKYELDKLS